MSRLDFIDDTRQVLKERGEGDVYYEQEDEDRIRFTGIDGHAHFEDSSLSQVSGYGIRLIEDGRMGFSYGNKTGIEDVRKTVDYAAQAAKLSEPYAVRLPKNEGGEISPLKSEVDLFSKGLEISDALLARGVKTFSVVTKKISKHWELCNTNGGHVYSEEEVCYFEVESVVTGKHENMNFWLTITSCPESLDINSLVQKALDRAFSSLDGEAIGLHNVPVVFDVPDWGLMWYVLLSALNGTNVERDKSFFSHKQGTEVLSRNMNIRLEREHEKVPSKYAFDHEGVEIESIALVEKGTFVTPYYSLASAAQFNTKPSGVGYRESFKNQPEERPFILSLTFPGAESLASLDKYILITFTQGLVSGGLNSVSGAFSLGANGALVDKGERSPVRGVTLSGNIWEALRQIVAVGGEEAVYPLGLFPKPTGPWLVSPLVALDGITVTG